MDELRKAREEANISQGDLAKALGISQTMLSRLEVGEREPEKGFPERCRATLTRLIDERDARAKKMLAQAPTADAPALATV